MKTAKAVKLLISVFCLETLLQTLQIKFSVKTMIQLCLNFILQKRKCARITNS